MIFLNGRSNLVRWMADDASNLGLRKERGTGTPKNNPNACIATLLTPNDICSLYGDTVTCCEEEKKDPIHPIDPANVRIGYGGTRTAF